MTSCITGISGTARICVAGAQEKRKKNSSPRGLYFLDNNKFHTFARRSSIIVIVAARAPVLLPRDKELDKDKQRPVLAASRSLRAISSGAGTRLCDITANGRRNSRNR